MLKIGVLGAGHLGKIHIKLLQQIPAWKLIGFFDPSDENAAKAIELYGIKRFNSVEELLAEVDAVDIVTPTLSHYNCAIQAINAGKHVFIEKPLTNTAEEAEKLMNAIEKTNLKGMVGHVERFNPAFLAAKDKVTNPMFIETHRLATFNPRGTDVSVVLDLMIHDLDVVLSLVKSKVKSVAANGVAVLSDTPDIANARISFENGCVANVTASRISVKNMRKSRFFRNDSYISIDFLEKKAEIVALSETQHENALELDTGKGEKKYITFNFPDVEEVNSIKLELELFAEAIVEDKETEVTLADGYKALKLAYQIMDQINNNAIS